VPVLFADVEAAWAETREQAERVARFGVILERAGSDDPVLSLAEVDLRPIALLPSRPQHGAPSTWRT
jgi:hypothetical protein